MRIGRRHFLIGTAAAAVTALGAYAGFLALHDPRSRGYRLASEAIEETLARYLPGTRLADGELETFVREFAGLREDILRRGVRARRGQFGAEKRARTLARFEATVLRDFLMSSDYYLKPASARDIVRLVRPVDPYAAGCGNPLAQFEFG